MKWAIFNKSSDVCNIIDTPFSHITSTFAHET